MKVVRTKVTPARTTFEVVGENLNREMLKEHFANEAPFGFGPIMVYDEGRRAEVVCYTD